MIALTPVHVRVCVSEEEEEEGVMIKGNSGDMRKMMN